MSENRAKPDQYQLRFPPGMRERLKATADEAGRSMNAEIIARLERSFELWPQIYLTNEIRKRAMEASQEQRDLAEWTISEEASKILETMFPKPDRDIRHFYEAFDAMLHDVPEEARPRFRENFQQLVMEMLDEELQAPDPKPLPDSEIPF
jgi:predicted DNA-binding protein